MLSSVLKNKKEDFLQYINLIWKSYGEVNVKQLQEPMGDNQNILKFISIMAEKMYNERLAAQVENEIIIGWQFWAPNKK
jgi:hypothetical protein